MRNTLQHLKQRHGLAIKSILLLAIFALCFGVYGAAAAQFTLVAGALLALTVVVMLVIVLFG